MVMCAAFSAVICYSLREMEMFSAVSVMICYRVVELVGICDVFYSYQYGFSQNGVLAINVNVCSSLIYGVFQGGRKGGKR